MHLLSDEEKKKSARYRFKKDRESFIVSRAAQRIGLGTYLNISPETVHLTYTDKGKSLYSNDQEKYKIYFNASHSGKLILLGFTRLSEIGVDIERVRFFPEIDRMAQQLFTKKEYEIIKCLPDEEKAPLFYCYWTRKEAVLKAMGMGLSQPLNTIDVSCPEVSAINSKCIQVKHEKVEWIIMDVPISNDILAAVAIRPYLFDLECRYYFA